VPERRQTSKVWSSENDQLRTGTAKYSILCFKVPSSHREKRHTQDSSPISGTGGRERQRTRAPRPSPNMLRERSTRLDPEENCTKRTVNRACEAKVRARLGRLTDYPSRKRNLGGKKLTKGSKKTSHESAPWGRACASAKKHEQEDYELRCLV